MRVFQFLRALLFYITMSCGIYKITAQDGKIYIGKSKNIEKRWQGYKCAFTKLSGQPDLYISFKKFGWFNHNFEIIEECDESEIGCREFYWQHFYDVLGDNGLNMQYGSCYNISFQERLFELKNIYFRKSVLLYLYKNESLENINFNVKKYKQRRREKTTKKDKNVVDRTNILPNLKGDKYKIILDVKTGVFYYSLKELCTLYNLKYTTMRDRLEGKVSNKTQFIYT